MTDQDSRSQWIALALVILGMISTGLADHFNLRDLANAGTTAIGLGGGLLTGKYMHSLQSGSNPTMVVDQKTAASESA